MFFGQFLEQKIRVKWMKETVASNGWWYSWWPDINGVRRYTEKLWQRVLRRVVGFFQNGKPSKNLKRNGMNLNGEDETLPITS